MKTFLKEKGKAIRSAVGIGFLMLFTFSCDKTEDTALTEDDQVASSAMLNVKRLSKQEIDESVKFSSSLIERVHNDSIFASINTENGRIQYMKNILEKEKGIKSELPADFFSNIKIQMNEMGAGLGETQSANRGARTATLYTNYTSNQVQFMNWVEGQVGSSQNNSDFQANMHNVEVELTRGYWGSVLDATGESGAMWNYIYAYEDYVLQWPDDLDNFEPFGQWGQIYQGPGSRVQGQCRGFWKKMCIAKWTAFIAIAGSVSGPGGTIIGAAAGYLIGRCCKCGCSCDIVVCDL